MAMAMPISPSGHPPAPLQSERCYAVSSLQDVELPLEASATSYQLRRISHCRWHPQFRFIEPAFAPVIIGIVLAGEGIQMDANGSWTALLPGYLFVCGNGSCRGHAVTSASGLEVLFMVTHTTATAQLVTAHLGPLPLAVPVPRVGELEQLFRILLREGRRMESQSVRTCNCLGEALILQAAAALAIGPRPLSTREAAFLQARRHILDHVAEPLTATSVAAAIGISRAYLSRIFAEFAGESPRAYILRQRIAAASEHLQHHAASVKETAYALGFSDPLSFSRTFKRLTGHPPSTLLHTQ
jgi:AraC-like DNA-binding protein